jgi:cytidylate kinase
MKKINIAIDGYSSCGKGTIARFLAAHLGYRFVDTGAMYRAVTLYLLQQQVDLNDEDQVVSRLPEISLGFNTTSDAGMFEITLNGTNVEHEIRGLNIAAEVSKVAAISEVRRFLVAQQKEIAKNKGVVMDGRDIGTVVLPEAELKIFMTARPEVRAMRRFAELERAGVKTTYEDVLKNINHRDSIDSSRADSPLTYTADYKVLDNSDLTPVQQNAIAIQWVNQSQEM